MGPTAPGAPPPRAPICRAPWVTLEFDAFGDVQACCANALYPLGSVVTSTIDEIWHGPRARGLREALDQGDLSLGCSVCRHRLDTQGAELPLEAYGSFPMPDGVPEWPHRLSFSLHNTCNLECVMCGADRSSKIRSRRVGLAPLPHRYGPDFFEQLVPYLRHAQLIDFVGGEPFLVREHWRVWELMEELGVGPRCAVTTNGTVWNDRVAHVLDLFDTDVFVSIDGCTRATFERVRVGASFDEVYGNLERLRAYAAERGTYLAINWSFVRHNWHELPDMLRWAEERHLPVNVMTVIEPEHGVQRLPDDELRVVVDTMERWDASLAQDLDRNLEVWRRQLTMVQAELARRRSGTPRQALMEPAGDGDLRRIASSILALAARDHAPGGAARRDAALASLRRWGVDHRRGGLEEGALRCAADGSVRWASLGTALPEIGVPDHLEDLLDELAAALGGILWVAEHVVEDDAVQVGLWIGRADRDKLGIALRLHALPLGGEVEVLVSRDRWFAEGAPPAASPVGIVPSPRRRSPVAPAN